MAGCHPDGFQLGAFDRFDGFRKFTGVGAH